MTSIGTRSELAGGFSGEVILPGNASYDDARSIFNTMIDRRPSVIAQCGTVQDVVKALAFGREQRLEIAVRGGGHSVAGKSLTDGGIVLDLRRMNGVTVDPVAKTATVGGGATMSDLDRACERYGLATTGGRVSTTGVGGFTLGGGSGWLDRKFGLACDNLISVELVTANGDVVTASDEENPELFWALHGGGGNFGVATSFVFRLYNLPVATLGLFIWDASKGHDLLRAYRDFIDTAPDEVNGGFFYFTGPAEEPNVPRLFDQLVAAVVVTFAGGEAASMDHMNQMLALEPEGSMVAEMSYADLNCAIDDPPGFRNYWSAEYLTELPDEAIDGFCSRASDLLVPSPSQHVVFPAGGAVGRATTDYPIPWRKAPWVVHPFCLWSDPSDDERSRRFARDVRADMQPWASGDVYLNFIGDEGEARVIAGYGADNYKRLQAVKSVFDPDNVFKLNHNIKPA
jgi:FAD/FMN-containing dehydrogenase